MYQQPRSDVDDAYRIDLTPLFDDAAHWEAERDRLRNDLADGPPDAETLADRDRLAAALDRHQRVVNRSQALDVHSQLRSFVDTDDDDWQRRRREYESVAADVADDRAAFQRALAALGADRAVELAREAGHGEYERFLRDAADAAARRRDPAVEGLLNAMTDEFDTGVRTIVAATTKDFDPPTVETPDGEREVTTSALRDLGKHPDRDVRRRAREAFLAELAGFEHTVAAAYADKVSKHVRVAEERGFDAVREKALTSESYPPTGLRNHLPDAAYGAMLDALQDNLGPYHRYLERRRELLGVETLRTWDLNAPLAEPDAPEVPYETACEHVLDAVEPLGSAYRDRLAAYLDDRRVDVFPAAGKRQDIPAMAPATSAHGSFLFANYDETVRTAFYLAHELGHAMAQSHATEHQPTVYATVPRPISEVPSIVHEVLLAEHLLDAGDRDLAAHVRDRYFDFAVGNLYGAGQGATSTDACYRTVEAGEELTLETIREEHASARDQFAPMVEGGEHADSAWLRGSLVREPYSNYQYVLGAAGALTTAHRLLDGDMDPETYRETLSLGGRVPPVEWFDRLGLDVANGGMVADATGRVDDLVARLL